MSDTNDEHLLEVLTRQREDSETMEEYEELTKQIRVVEERLRIPAPEDD